MNIELRLAEIENLEELQPLVHAYHQFEGIEGSEAQRESGLRRLLSDPALGGIWLIFTNGVLAGYIVLCRGFSIEFNGFDAFIDEFYLTPEFRRQGIGSQVLIAIRQIARQMEIHALHLEVARDNRRARRFYSAAGFEARNKYLLMSAGLEEQ